MPRFQRLISYTTVDVRALMSDYSISQEICTRFFALLCFVVVIHWRIFPYPSGLLHWHSGNLTIAPVPAKQPWWIWINTSCEFIMNDCITTTKQSTTKPCAYFLGYTVHRTGYVDEITYPYPGPDASSRYYLLVKWPPGGCLNIKMLSYPYRKSHCEDKTVVRSYLHNGISYTGKMTSLYWIRALDVHESGKLLAWHWPQK